MGEPRPFESDPLLYGTIEDLHETIDLDETKQRPELADAMNGYYVAYKVMAGKMEMEKCGQVVDVVLSRRMLIVSIEGSDSTYPPLMQGMDPEQQMVYEEVSYDLPSLMWFKDVLAENKAGGRPGHHLSGNISNPRSPS